MPFDNTARYDLRKLLLSEYWLTVSLCGIFITSYSLNYKGTGIFLGISAIFIGFHLVFGDFTLKEIPSPYIFLFFLIIYLVLESLVFSFENTDSGRIGRLGKFFVIVFSIHIISRGGINKFTILASGIVIGLSILWQYSEYFPLNIPYYGTFTNPHYLANLVLLTLPFTYYFFFTTVKTYKIVFFLLCVLNLQLLILSSSRTAIIGLIFSWMLIIILYSRTRIKLAGTLLLTFFLILIYLTDYANIYSRFHELFITITTEERTILWPLGWQLLSDNSWIGWLFGNGLGEIAQSIPSSSHQLFPDDSFPHLSIFELLYENGIIATVLIIYGFFYLFFRLFSFIKATQNQSKKLLAMCIVTALMSFLFHTGITMHFYSKQTLYTLAFMIGLALPLILQLSNSGLSHLEK